MAHKQHDIRIFDSIITQNVHYSFNSFHKNTHTQTESIFTVNPDRSKQNNFY